MNKYQTAPSGSKPHCSDWRYFPGVAAVGQKNWAVRRLRGISSLDALLRTLLWHFGCGLSLLETAIHAKLAGIVEYAT